MRYDYNAISNLLNIGAMDYDGQTVATFDLQNQKGSHPAVIVVMNGYGEFVKSLLLADELESKWSPWNHGIVEEFLTFKL